MRRLRIVSDSSSDLIKLERAEFAYSPMKIITAEREFVDDESLNVDEMADYFNEYKGRSQTSCPNAADWLEAFGEADDVICVTITSGLSGSYNSACSAKRIYEYEGEGRRVFVLDTLSAGPEITLIVQKLEEYVASGMEYGEICKKITEYKNKTRLLFMLRSLKNFANNGRVSPVVAKIVGIAGICIVGRASEQGTLEPCHKCRGEVRSLEVLVSEMENMGFDGGKVSIGHCQNLPAARKILSLIKSKFPDAQVKLHKLRGLCSFYAEKGGVLVGFEMA